MSADDAESQYLQHIRQQRERKDEFFRSNPQSPLPDDARDAFDGLSYFDVDPSMVYELELHEFDEHDGIQLDTTGVQKRLYYRWGEFRFEVEGESVTLTAYKQETEDDRLWVPFRDATSGEETYGAGRYLDLERETDFTQDGTWILDFNTAYSPFCAYSAEYVCPMVPMENWLDVPIRAGETAPTDVPTDHDVGEGSALADDAPDSEAGNSTDDSGMVGDSETGDDQTDD